MKTDVIITGFSNANSEGVILHTNIPAKLKTGNVRGRSTWVSWDKIGELLFDDYTKETDVETLNKLRQQ
jgi:hypothetical protein